MKDVSRVCRSPLACTELGPLSHQERSVGYFDLLRAARYALTRSESCFPCARRSGTGSHTRRTVAALEACCRRIALARPLTNVSASYETRSSKRPCFVRMEWMSRMCKEGSGKALNAWTCIAANLTLSSSTIGLGALFAATETLGEAVELVVKVPSCSLLLASALSWALTCLSVFAAAVSYTHLRAHET